MNKVDEVVSKLIDRKKEEITENKKEKKDTKTILTNNFKKIGVFLKR